MNAKNTYIYTILWDKAKLAAKVDVLKFKNKRLIKALKFEKQKRNRGKQLNLLGEKNGSPQLFSLSYVQAAREFIAKKKANKE